MSDYKLILHPVNPFAGLAEVTSLADKLKAIGFLGEAGDMLFTKGIIYKPGDKFFEWIQFFKEYTTILLEKTDQGLVEVGEVPNRTTCVIELTHVSPEPEVIASGYTVPPLCSYCQYQTADINPIIGAWWENKATYRWICPNCQKEARIEELDWLKGTGFARYGIHVWHIHTDEAVPAQGLLNHLRDLTGEAWTFMYYHF